MQTTLGRALFNETLPVDYPFFNQQAGKSQISAIVNNLAERYPKTEVAATLDRIKDARLPLGDPFRSRVAATSPSGSARQRSGGIRRNLALAGLLVENG